MPLDHFVPQVHLRNFYDPPIDRMSGMRRRDLHQFPCRSEDVCRAEGNSTNEWLQEPRIVEEFLRTVEPQYNRALAGFRAGAPTSDDVRVIAGFIAYVATCSPAAMRINSGPIRGSLEATANLMDAWGDLPPSPPELGGRTLSELLAEGVVNYAIDRRFTQAIGIGNILARVARFGNWEWEVLINDDGTFFTSDFPIAVEETDNVRIINRVVPLAADLAVRLKPDLDRAPSRDFSFPDFTFRTRRLRHSEVRYVNQLVVRCAEELVFYRQDAEWVRRFVGRQEGFRLDSHTLQMQMATRQVTWTRLEVRRNPPS